MKKIVATLLLNAALLGAFLAGSMWGLPHLAGKGEAAGTLTCYYVLGYTDSADIGPNNPPTTFAAGTFHSPIQGGPVACPAGFGGPPSAVSPASNQAAPHGPLVDKSKSTPAQTSMQEKAPNPWPQH